MVELDIFPWRIYCDEVATREIYEQIEKGGSDECTCCFCRNFRKVRDKVFPDEVLKVFEKLGIDYRKDSEFSQTHRTKTGLQHYMGSFHFVGRVECIDEDESGLRSINDNFSWAFENDKGTPHDKAFNGQQLGEIWITMNVPWIIGGIEPE